MPLGNQSPAPVGSRSLAELGCAIAAWLVHDHLPTSSASDRLASWDVRLPTAPAKLIAHT
ncbi:MAG: hypothetical protein F6K47_23650 [Symploca sp. SIO2E6]|nr:hypothetical protein [Symploca sp. SIO2E6]